MRVVALYRHPIKSFPAEPCDALEVSDDGRVVGDRVLGFRFDDAGPPNDVSGDAKPGSHPSNTHPHSHSCAAVTTPRRVGHGSISPTPTN